MKGVLEAVYNIVRKIDSKAVNGLLGVYNSLSYRVNEIERHHHNREKWFGLATTASGEVHVADRMAGGIQPFRLTAGNDDFGAWVQLLGSSDTPVSSGSMKFDGHRFMVSATNSTNPYIIQVIHGESADFAAKLAAEEFTESPYISASNNNDSGVSDIMAVRVDSGVKVWARTACIGGNGTTIDIYFGIHEYEG